MIDLFLPVFYNCQNLPNTAKLQSFGYPKEQKMRVKSAFGNLSITSITPSITLEMPMNKGKVIDVIDVIDVFQLLDIIPLRLSCRQLSGRR